MRPLLVTSWSVERVEVGVLPRMLTAVRKAVAAVEQHMLTPRTPTQQRQVRDHLTACTAALSIDGNHGHFQPGDDH